VTRCGILLERWCPGKRMRWCKQDCEAGQDTRKMRLTSTSEDADLNEPSTRPKHLLGHKQLDSTLRSVCRSLSRLSLASLSSWTWIVPTRLKVSRSRWKGFQSTDNVWSLDVLNFMITLQHQGSGHVVVGFVMVECSQCLQVLMSRQ
jgi:hypothetical protein